MAGNKRWTPAEDNAIREVAYETAYAGITKEGRRLARLRELSEKLPGRSYAAVRRRASRIRAHSYGYMSRRNHEMRFLND